MALLFGREDVGIKNKIHRVAIRFQRYMASKGGRCKALLSALHQWLSPCKGTQHNGRSVSYEIE